MSDTNALISRLREATGAKYVLDCEIWLAVHPDDGVIVLHNPPPYTADVGAALRLVPEGMEWSVSTLHGLASVEIGLNCSAHNGPWSTVRKDGNVPLAICATALEARAILAGKSDVR